MAKVKEEKLNLDETIAELNKKFGQNTVLALDEKKVGTYETISSSSIYIDYVALGIGGFAKGKMYELRGWEGCLAPDTFIQYRAINTKTGKIEHKGETIENFYNKFNKIKGRNGKRLRKDIDDCIFTVPCMNDEGFIIHNKVNKVVSSGIKKVYKLTSAMGYSIEATQDHKFYTGGEWKKLGDLVVGDSVYIHNRTTFKKEPNRKFYKEVSVKYHPKWNKKVVEGKYEFYRTSRSRATYEAHMNNMGYTDYIIFLNTAKREEIDNLKFIPEGYYVHHINENTTDDRLENLALVDGQEHNKHHAIKGQNNMRFVTVEDSIVSIEEIGEKETYDIVCEDPYRNFVANNFVVHNSGKTTICGHIVSNCQKNGGRAAYIDGEHAVDLEYFKALGVDCSKLFISQPDYGEAGFEIAHALIKSGEIDLLIIDSDSALLPKSVLEGEIGETTIGKKAKLNSDAYPKLKLAINKYNVCCVVISQYREKIGVMFGKPDVTQGGKALGFYADVIVEMSKSPKKEGDEVSGNITRFKAIKNKTYPPFKKVEFDILFGEGIDKVGEMLELGNQYDLFKKWGKTVTYNEVKYDIDEFISYIKDNQEFYDGLKTKVIESIKNDK